MTKKEVKAIVETNREYALWCADNAPSKEAKMFKEALGTKAAAPHERGCWDSKSQPTK